MSGASGPGATGCSLCLNKERVFRLTLNSQESWESSSFFNNLDYCIVVNVPAGFPKLNLVTDDKLLVNSAESQSLCVGNNDMIYIGVIIALVVICLIMGSVLLYKFLKK